MAKKETASKCFIALTLVISTTWKQRKQGEEQCDGFCFNIR